MSEVFHLVYMSRAVEDLSYTDIREILETSRKNNTRDGITGMLILRDDYFLQIIEGSKQTVKDCLSRILLDDRNFDLKVLVETQSSERLLPDWSMAFHDGDISSASTSDLAALFEVCRKNDKDFHSFVWPMLRKFKDSAPELK